MGNSKAAGVDRVGSCLGTMWSFTVPKFSRRTVGLVDKGRL